MDPCGSCRCGLIHTSPQLLLSFILPFIHNHMERPRCPPGTLKKSTYPFCFKLFNNPSRKRSPEDFMPFEAKTYGSEDFKIFSNQGFFKGNATLGARCLSPFEGLGDYQGIQCYCGSLLSLTGSESICLVQMLPIPQPSPRTKTGVPGSRFQKMGPRK